MTQFLTRVRLHIPTELWAVKKWAKQRQTAIKQNSWPLLVCREAVSCW